MPNNKRFGGGYGLCSQCTALLLTLCLVSSSLLTSCATKQEKSPTDVAASTSQNEASPQGSLTAAQDTDRQFASALASTEGHDARMQTSIPPSQNTVYPHLNTTMESSLDDYESPRSSISDPLEPWNRFWFHFNDIFFLYVARPLYRGYEFVTPQELRTGLKNFLANLMFPIRFVNCFLQGKPMAAGVEFGRFIINTTVGFGGLIDVAKGVKAVVPVDPSGEDFGQTLGVWGMGQGFYLVWPLIGPSSARASIGLGADSFLDPTFYMRPWELAFATAGSLRFNSMGDILSLYEDMNQSAVDPYVAMREAYSAYKELRLAQ